MKVQELRKPLQKEMISPLEDTPRLQFSFGAVQLSRATWSSPNLPIFVGLDSTVGFDCFCVFWQKRMLPHRSIVVILFKLYSRTLLSEFFQQSLARCEHGVSIAINVILLVPYFASDNNRIMQKRILEGVTNPPWLLKVG